MLVDLFSAVLSTLPAFAGIGSSIRCTGGATINTASVDNRPLNSQIYSCKNLKHYITTIQLEKLYMIHS
jgi:hypothetical protein